ncbi:MAG: ABC transporter permease [Propionibacteriaceae bacterium]|nr:ABC transporter permease [Propionibacteriaceae bacterium]
MTAVQETSAPAGQARRTRRGAARNNDWLLGIVGVIAALLIWELAGRAGLLSQEVIPGPLTVLARLGELATTPAFWLNVWATLQSALLGLVTVLVIASVLALLIGLVPAFRESTWFLVEFLKPIPPIALIPLGLLLWGPSLTMKLTLITFGALWPLLTQLVYGIRETDKTVLDMSKSYRLGWWLTTTRIIVPTLLPYALTGLRISASIAVVVAVVTELVGGARGMGQAIAVAQVNNNLPTLYAYVVAAGLLGILVNLAFMVTERPLLFWHPSVRERG